MLGRKHVQLIHDLRIKRAMCLGPSQLICFGNDGWKGHLDARLIVIAPPRPAFAASVYGIQGDRGTGGQGMEYGILIIILDALGLQSFVFLSGSPQSRKYRPMIFRYGTSHLRGFPTGSGIVSPKQMPRAKLRLVGDFECTIPTRRIDCLCSGDLLHLFVLPRSRLR